MLDGVAVATLNDDERLQFWLNVFHTLLLHAHIDLERLFAIDTTRAHTAELSKVARVSLFRAAAYRVGGQRYSLLEIEHAVLVSISFFVGIVLIVNFFLKNFFFSICALKACTRLCSCSGFSGAWRPFDGAQIQAERSTKCSGIERKNSSIGIVLLFYFISPNLKPSKLFFHQPPMLPSSTLSTFF